MAGTRGKAASDEVTRYIRDWIVREVAAGRKTGEIAKQLGVTRTTVVFVRDHARGVGLKMEEGFARAVFGGSVDALRRAAGGDVVALQGAEDVGELTQAERVRLVFEYALRVERLEPEAVQRALTLCRDGVPQLEPGDLLDWIRSTSVQIRYEKMAELDDSSKRSG